MYRAAGDDAWIAITVRDDDEWAALVDLVGGLTAWRHAPLEERRAAQEQIDAAIAAWTAVRSPYEAATLLQEAGVAAFPVMTNADLVGDPQIAARGFVATWDQPDVGLRSFPGFPIHFEHAPVRISPAPPLGGHNRAVLSEVLGYDEEHIDRLYEEGILADRPPFD